MKDSIELSSLKSGRIDLAQGYANTVYLRGQYKGERISIYNSSNKELIFEDGFIETTHREDALVIADAAMNVTLRFADFDLVFGGLTFWKGCKNITVTDVRVLYPHTGIRYTQTEKSENILIDNAYILAPQFEGIYWGASKVQEEKHTNVKIVRCVVLQAGWDGIQVGNVNGVVSSCTVDGYGLRKTTWQDKGIQANPGCILHVADCQVRNGTGQQYVSLDSRMFIDT